MNSIQSRFVTCASKATNLRTPPPFKKLINDKRTEPNIHTKVYRPWGFYDSIETGDGFQVKRIMVKPGAKLSLQKHNHRSEHWVVVSGCATIICGQEKFTMQKNQSTFIPNGEVHRLENHGDIPLEIIEIQTGQILKETDIVRYKDVYDRIN